MPRQYGRMFFTAVAAPLLLLGAACKPQTPVPPAQPAAANPNSPITNMILIKAGICQRGKYQVTLTQDFWIGKYEVTQGEYESLMKTNTSHFADNPNRPVEKVKFTEAAAYCAALTQREMNARRIQSGYSYRLPTEAEWEYACRAGSTNLLSFGDEKNFDEYAWTLDKLRARGLA